METGNGTSGAPPAQTNGPTTSFDHAWGVDEIKKNADQWSLAADVGLLEHMKAFASRLTAQAHDVSREVSQLLHDTELTDAKIQTVTDYFLTLSDSQFIENRVYDEDDSVDKEKAEEKKEEAKIKTREQREAEMLPRLKESVRFCVDVIDDAYDVLDVKVVDSDSEDEDDIPLPSDEVILEPKDPYIARPLPYLIGSRGFYEEADVGVGDLLSSDDLESEAGSVSDSEEEIEKAPTVSDVSSSEYDTDEGITDESDDDDGSPVVRKKTKTVTSSDEMSSTDEDDMFADTTESDEEEPVVVKNRTNSKKRSKSKRSQQSQDMFGQDEPEDDLFAPSGGLFGKGGGLFDAPKDGGLFEGIDQSDDSDNDEVEQEAPVVEKQSESPKKAAKKQKKKPLGGISLFGGAIKKGFFNKDKQDQSESSEEEAEPVMANQKSSGMFDESDSDGEDDGLFDEKAKPAKKEASQPSTNPVKSGGLFDDTDDDDGDLFNDEVEDEEEETLPEKPAPKTKRPVGGVSMFGGEGGSSLQEVLKRRASSSSSDVGKINSSTKNQTLNSKPKSKQSINNVNKEPQSSLFATSSDDDGLFGTKNAAAKTPKSKNADPIANMKSHDKKTPNQKKGSLFGSSDSSDEDLFGESSKSRSKSSTLTSSHKTASLRSAGSNTSLSSRKSQQSTKASKTTSRLFNDEANKNSKPFSKSTKAQITQNRPKTDSKSNLFNESDSDSDLFSTSKSTQAKPISKSIVQELSDEDDMFNSKPPSSISSVSSSGLSRSRPSQPAKNPLQSKAKPKSSLFDESDDDLDESVKVTEVKQPQQVTKGHEKSKVTSRTKGLFAESESDEDLFSDMKTSKPPVTTKPKHQNKEKDSVKKTSGNTPKKPVAKPPKKAKDLFDSESSDEDLFAAKPSTKSKPQKPPSLFEDESTPQKDKVEQKSEEEEKEEEEEEEVPQKKKLAGAVSMFGVGGGELLAAIGKRRSASQKSSSSNKSDKERTISKASIGDIKEKDDKDQVTADLFAVKPSVKSTPAPNVTAKPFSSPSSGETKRSVSKVSPPSAKSSGNIGSLQANLAINPSALLPGAAPKIISKIDTDAPLESATKTRSRGQAGRRPPSRQARRKIAETSEPDIFPTTTPSIPQSVPPSHPIDVPVKSETKTKPVAKKEAEKTDFLDDLLASTSSTSKKESKSPVVGKKKPKLPDLFGDDDDFFTKPSKPESTKKLKADDLFSSVLDDEDDMFSSSKTKKSKPPSKTDIFADDADAESSSSLFSEKKSEKPKSKKHNLFADDLFGDFDDIGPPVVKLSKPATQVDDDEDIFGDVLTTSTKKASKPNEDKQSLDDDIFGETKSLSHVKSSNTKDKNAKDNFNEDIFGESSSSPSMNSSKLKEDKTKSNIDDVADLFGDAPDSPVVKKTKKQTKSKGLQKVDLFDGDDSDIFGDLPISKPKKKTAPEVQKSIFDDDDIFSSTAPTAKKSSSGKAKKGKTKKQTKKAAAPSHDSDIFEDPLNALLGT